MIFSSRYNRLIDLAVDIKQQISLTRPTPQIQIKAELEAIQVKQMIYLYKHIDQFPSEI